MFAARDFLRTIPVLGLLGSLLTALTSYCAHAREPAKPTFNNEGVAFLRKHCIGCHGEAKPKADLSLNKFTDTASLLRDRKTWQRVQDVLKAGEMPPKNKPQPTLSEVESFTKLVTELFEHADRNAKPDPGRVTMRRLNRNEYNNTIRDLIGVDFNPAEDFPSDDVGYGFDNIGDVLTLPPVLMERYLAAAESIMERAIVPNPPKPPNRGLGAWFTEPASAKVPLKNNFRVVTTKGTDPVETGPIHTSYKVPEDGEYIFRTRVFAETTGTAPVKVAILAACRPGAPGEATDKDVEALSGGSVKGLRPFVILKIVEVKARTEKTAETIEVKIPANIGLHRTAVALLKPASGEPDPTLYLQQLLLEGPLDTRPASHRKLLACDPKKTQPEQTREVLTRFLTRAYRRPVTNDELNRLIKLADAAFARGEKWEAGIQLAMQAALVSPKFLFRVELDDRPASADSHPIDEFQLASRLSYFIWASMPDEELLQLATRQELSKNLDAQVRRMLQDPKARTLVDFFVLQWLQIQTLKNFQPDPKLFPQFNEQLRAAMLQETRLFFEAIIREDRNVLTILDADFTYANADLARHYGFSDTEGNLIGQKPTRPKGMPFKRDEFSRVSVSGTTRGGVLTHASVLAVTSNPTRTSPVKRGRWVLEQLLGTPPPPPPPNVPELEKDGKPLTSGSLRQRMEEHRKNVACANCHAKMDPLGFGLENFNAIGAFRKLDGEFPIDPSGVLPDGTTFAGPDELKKILMGKKELFVRCVIEKMMIYALGRGLEYYDKRTVDQITAELTKQDYRFSALVAGIVKSEPFRLRRGKEQQ